MRRVLLALAAFIFTLSLTAQDAKKPAKNLNWKKGGTFSINVGQGGSRNWAAGAEKFSFNAAAYLNLYATRTKGKNTWMNTLDLGYAMVNTTSLGVRKNDDKIDFFSKWSHEISPKFSWGFAGNVRTQFRNGYDYSETPKRRTSGFFAPGYITAAPGFDFKPCNSFSVFFTPAAARFVAVTNNPYSFTYQGGVKPNGDPEVSLASRYGVDPARMVRFELGSYVSANFNKEVVKNVNYKSRVDLFSNYLESEPFNIDVFWNNSVNMSVNKWLQVTYNFDLIYDHDVQQFGPFKNRPGTQLRSMLGVGLATKF
jgi:Protein of unknown function (DUF3078)